MNYIAKTAQALAVGTALVSSFGGAYAAEKYAFAEGQKIPHVGQVANFVYRDHNIKHPTNKEIMYMSILKCKGHSPALILYDTKPYGKANEGDKLKINVYETPKRVSTHKIENGKLIFSAEAPELLGSSEMSLDGKVLSMTGNVDPDFFPEFWQDLNNDQCLQLLKKGGVEIRLASNKL